MSKLTKLTLLALLCLMPACQKQAGSRAGSGETLTGSPPIKSNGTVDGAGGGNGVNGKMLEHYHVSMETQPDVQQAVMPVLKELVKVNPKLAGRMLFILRERTWYFLPTDLNKLKEERIGTYFPTDQLALQDLRSVWIDSRAFNKMDDIDDREFTIVHEAIMGTRLLAYARELDRCLADSSSELLTSDPKADENFRKARRACFMSYPQNALLASDNLGVGQKLSDADYDDIRKLTEKITDSNGKLDAEELEQFLSTTKIPH